MEEFNACFKTLDDPRTDNASLRSRLGNLVIALCAVLCGSQTAVDMAEFGVASKQ